jgi:hypothetical protein
MREGGTWTYPTQPLAAEEGVSHGYCPECAKTAFGELYRRAAALESVRRTAVHAA